MQQTNVIRFRTSTELIPGIALMGAWLAGLSLGLLDDRFYGDCYASLAFQAGMTELIFSDACMATILPLLLSAFAVFFFHRFGACLACFLRGLTLGFLLAVLVGAGGAWLAVLLLFSGLGCCPVLLWYLWRRCLLGLCDARRDFLRSFLAGLCLAAVDTWVVAPFLAAALTF